MTLSSIPWATSNFRTFQVFQTSDHPDTYLVNKHHLWRTSAWWVKCCPWPITGSEAVWTLSWRHSRNCSAAFTSEYFPSAKMQL